MAPSASIVPVSTGKCGVGGERGRKAAQLVVSGSADLSVHTTTTPFSSETKPSYRLQKRQFRNA